jgi:elongation factor G
VISYLDLEPADEVDGKVPVGLQFVVKGGNVPKEYIPSVEKGLEAENGSFAGYQVDSLKVPY